MSAAVIAAALGDARRVGCVWRRPLHCGRRSLASAGWKSDHAGAANIGQISWVLGVTRPRARRELSAREPSKGQTSARVLPPHGG